MFMIFKDYVLNLERDELGGLLYHKIMLKKCISNIPVRKIEWFTHTSPVAGFLPCLLDFLHDTTNSSFHHFTGTSVCVCVLSVAAGYCSHQAAAHQT